jgi:hypothetical protein
MIALARLADFLPTWHVRHLARNPAAIAVI